MLTGKDISVKQALGAERGGSMAAAIITGQLSGLIMAVVVMVVFALFLGRSPLYPVQVIGSMAFGEVALNGFQLPALLTGLVLHQAGPSLLWGLVFGLLARAFPVASVLQALRLGLVIGLVSMIGPLLLIPTLMQAFHGVDIWNREVPLFWDWAAHIVFGASFALYPYVQHRLARES